LRQLAQQVLGAKTSLRSADLAFQDRRIREMLEDRDNVGKGFVESINIRITRFVEPRMNAI
jgi:hypothetical protein